MSELIGISSSAIGTYQRALGVVSNNIANAATEGYSRQDVRLSSSASRTSGLVSLGTGVLFESVKRQYDTFVESNLRNSQSDLESQQPMVDYTNRVVDVMGGKESGLSDAFGQFFSALRSLSADPASVVLRSSFLRDAEGLASRFNQLSAQLDLVDSETQEAVRSSTTQMNALASQLAAVNQQLSKNSQLTKQPAELLDQRDRLLLELAQFVRINTSFAENGMVNVSLGASSTSEVLVQGGNFTRLEATFDSAAPERFTLVLDPYGQPRPLTGVSSGKLAGLISFREQVLVSSRSALDQLAVNLSRAVNDAHTLGIDATGARGQALFGWDPAHASGTLQVLLNDPLKVAAAGAFRVIEDANNPGTADASVRFVAPQYPGPGPLPQMLVNNPNPAAARTVTVPSIAGYQPLLTVPAGLDKVALFLDQAPATLQLQVLTRDGRHLAGQPLETSLHERLLTTANGFEPGASYSAVDLNQTDGTGYRGYGVFYGARADVRTQQNFDSNGTPAPPIVAAAQLQTERIASAWSGLGAGDHLRLNGVALGPLGPASGTAVQATDVAQWINQAQVAGVSAVAFNEIRVPSANIQLAETLVLNGVQIQPPSSAGFSSSAQLVQAINSQSASTGVMAYQDDRGQLVLTNVASQAGQNITVAGLTSRIPNALGLTGGTYTGQVRLQRQGNDTRPIELALGSQGHPALLGQLGLRTQLYFDGPVPDDLVVVMTGSGSAKLAATYSGQADDPAERLRQQPMLLEFTSPTHFRIIDRRSQTVLAERDFDPQAPNAHIHYQGLELRLSAPPKAGDRFMIDGNHDGLGDNQTVLDLADLEGQALMGSKTLGTAYVDLVNDMGNVARQAKIVQSSLKVVHDQAVSARDQVSGVSLDEEATNLIRFQQAYQASAKVLQVASQLLDTMLQIR